jgi:3-deoxy-D-manno-octulosonate 8-phosphate phosphatase (KDO 8-P phosphatase)
MTPPSLPPLVPSLQFAPEVLVRAQEVRVMFFDVDGIFTDGGLFFSEAGESLKRFNTLDGHGIKLLMRTGITPVIISGRNSAPLRTRLQQLGVEHAILGTEDKLPAAQQFLLQHQLDWHQVAAMGDDWPDLPVMRRCALAITTPQAHTEVVHMAHHITRVAGGQGAVREACDLVLVAGGHYHRLLQEVAH